MALDAPTIYRVGSPIIGPPVLEVGYRVVGAERTVPTLETCVADLEALRERVRVQSSAIETLQARLDDLHTHLTRRGWSGFVRHCRRFWQWFKGRFSRTH